MIKNVIVILILTAILGLATAYIVRQKKKGVKCIGCPFSGSCLNSVKTSCSRQDTQSNS